MCNAIKAPKYKTWDIKNYYQYGFALIVIITIITGILLFLILGKCSFIEHGILAVYVSSLIIIPSAFLAGLLTLQELRQQRQEIRDQRNVANKHQLANEKIAKETSRKKATLELITRTELDREYIDARATFQKYSNYENGEMEQLFASMYYLKKNNLEEVLESDIEEKENLKKKEKEHLLLRTFFNYFEMVSLAISKEIGSLDEDFFKKWQGTSFIEVWNRSSNTIGIIRSLSNNLKTYKEWEGIAQKWGQELEIDVKEAKIYSFEELTRLMDLSHPNEHNNAR